VGKELATVWLPECFLVPEVSMKRSAELRQRADHYRALKGRTADRQASQALGELADEFEMTAAALERRCRVRKRAHEIWIERGCPEGRDVEHWLLAERELVGEDQSLQRIGGSA
jgi:hypothetical protein